MRPASRSHARTIFPIFFSLPLLKIKILLIGEARSVFRNDITHPFAFQSDIFGFNGMSLTPGGYTQKPKAAINHFTKCKLPSFQVIMGFTFTAAPTRKVCYGNGPYCILKTSAFFVFRLTSGNFAAFGRAMPPTSTTSGTKGLGRLSEKCEFANNRLV